MSVCTGTVEAHGTAFMATPSFSVAVSMSIVLVLRYSPGAACAHQYMLYFNQ